jgi:hypothetical protein
MKNAIAENLKSPSTASGWRISQKKKTGTQTDSDDLLFLQESAESLFQQADQDEASEARRKTR